MLGMGCGVQAVTPVRRRDRSPHGLCRDPRFGLAAPCQEPAGIWTTGAGTSSTYSQLDSGEVWGWRRLLNLSSGKRKALALLCQRVLAAGVCVQLPLRPVCTRMPKGQLFKSLWQLGAPEPAAGVVWTPPQQQPWGGSQVQPRRHPPSWQRGSRLLLTALSPWPAESRAAGTSFAPASVPRCQGRCCAMCPPGRCASGLGRPSPRHGSGPFTLAL